MASASSWPGSQSNQTGVRTDLRTDGWRAAGWEGAGPAIACFSLFTAQLLLAALPIGACGRTKRGYGTVCVLVAWGVGAWAWWRGVPRKRKWCERAARPSTPLFRRPLSRRGTHTPHSHAMSAPPGYPGAWPETPSARTPGRLGAQGAQARACNRRNEERQLGASARPAVAAPGHCRVPGAFSPVFTSPGWPQLLSLHVCCPILAEGSREGVASRVRMPNTRAQLLSGPAPTLPLSHSRPAPLSPLHIGGAPPSAPPAGYPGTAPTSKPVFGGGGAPPASWGGYTMGQPGQQQAPYGGGLGPAGYGAYGAPGYPGAYQGYPGPNAGGGQQMYAGGPAAGSDCLGPCLLALCCCCMMNN